MKKALLMGLLWMSCVCSARAQAPTGGRPGAQPVNTKPGTGVHYVYLVRHGIYDRDTTVTDDRVGNGLNAQGHEQARLVGERLAGLGVIFNHLESSELLRAAQTADDMGHVMGMTPKRDAVLNECFPTSNNARYMASEKPNEIAECDSARLVQWERYFGPTPDSDTYDVLVCHGNVIRWTLMRTVGSDTKNWLNLDCGNGSLTIVAVRPDGAARLVMYSDVGHIPPSRQTWSGKGGGWVRGK